MRAWILAAVLLAGCSTTAPAAEEAMGQISGWVLDGTLRPVAGATVRADGLGSTTTDAEGRFLIRGNLSLDGHIVVAEAEGYRAASQRIEPVRPDQAIEVRLGLVPVPTGGYSRLATFGGFIACEVVLQVGHSHGSGGPAEDDRFLCPLEAAESRHFPIATETGPTDMLVEVAWQAGSPRAEWMALALWADDGELLGFVEGESVLRFELPRLKVQEYFGAGRNATLSAYVGIPEDEPGEVFLGAMVDQDFDVFVTTFYGMEMPTGHSVTA